MYLITFIVMLFIGLICKGVGNISEINERHYWKKRTQNPEEGTYLDQYCNTRLISDDTLVWKTRNAFGEIEIDYQNGRHRNLAQEEFDRKPGTVTRLAGYYDHNAWIYWREADGYRYKDRKTGDIYVVREFKNSDGFFNFYMNAETALIVRPTDGQYALEKEAKRLGRKYYDQKYFDDMIKDLNSHRKEWDDYYMGQFDIVDFYRNNNRGNDYGENLVKRMVRYRKPLATESQSGQVEETKLTTAV